MATALTRSEPTTKAEPTSKSAPCRNSRTAASQQETETPNDTAAVATFAVVNGPGSSAFCRCRRVRRLCSLDSETIEYRVDGRCLCQRSCHVRRPARKRSSRERLRGG